MALKNKNFLVKKKPTNVHKSCSGKSFTNSNKDNSNLENNIKKNKLNYSNSYSSQIDDEFNTLRSEDTKRNTGKVIEEVNEETCEDVAQDKPENDNETSVNRQLYYKNSASEFPVKSSVSINMSSPVNKSFIKHSKSKSLSRSQSSSSIKKINLNNPTFNNDISFEKSLRNYRPLSPLYKTFNNHTNPYGKCFDDLNNGSKSKIRNYRVNK